MLLAEQLKQLLDMHNIIPFYVPGSCTDEIQECDTVTTLMSGLIEGNNQT